MTEPSPPVERAADVGRDDGPVGIPGSRRIDFLSGVTGRPYRLLVSVPESPPPPAGHPVLFLVDGGLYFGTATEIVRLQGLNFITPPIVVGIGYAETGTRIALTRRMKDLTLPLDAAEIGAIPAAARAGMDTPEDSGGLDGYLAMLREEVGPMIAARWPVDGGRQVIFGHSLGGLAVLRQLMRGPGAYSGYIASSASIWLKGRAVLEDEEALEARLQRQPRPPAVVLLVGGDEEASPRLAPGDPTPPPSIAGIPPEEVRSLVRAAAMVANTERLAQRLGRMAGIRLTHVVFPDEDHASVVPAALSRGIRLTLAIPSPCRPG